jgi:hypothetical protein
VIYHLRRLARDAAVRVRAVSLFQLVRIMHSGESMLFATGR